MLGVGITVWPRKSGGGGAPVITVPVVSNFNGTNGSTVYVNENSGGPAIQAIGNSVLTTATFWMGTASVDSKNTSGAPVTATAIDVAAGQDFCFESRWRRDGYASKILSMGAANVDGGWALDSNVGSLTLFQHTAGGDVLLVQDTSTAVGNPSATFQHIVVKRKTGVVYVDVNGVQVMSTAAMAGALTGKLVWGSRYDGASLEGNGQGSYIDSTRFTLGDAVYPLTNYTPPTTEFTYP